MHDVQVATSPDQLMSLSTLLDANGFRNDMAASNDNCRNLLVAQIQMQFTPPSRKGETGRGYFTLSDVNSIPDALG